MTGHRTELRRELLAAAHRLSKEVDKVPVRQHPSRRVGVLVVACSVVALVLITVVTRDPERASAEVFDFTVVGRELVIEVVGPVDDPEAATADLDAEGVQARLVPVPAAPSLVGQVVYAFRDLGEMDSETDGSRTTLIRLPARSAGTLTLGYGRAAESDEDYEATESIPDCGTYARRTLTDGLRRQIREAHGPNLRWQEISDGVPSNIAGNAVSPNAQIVDVLPTAPQTVLIVVTDGASAPQDGMSCR